MSRRFAKMTGCAVVVVALTAVLTGEHAALSQGRRVKEKGRTERLSLINGDTVSGFVRCLNRRKQFEVQSTLFFGVVTVPIENVQRINCGPASEPLPAGPDRVVLTNQDTVSGKVKSMDSQSVVLETSYAGDVKIRRSMVKYILFGAATKSKEIARSVPKPTSEEDMVFFINQDRASGEVLSLKKNNLALKGDYGTIRLLVDHVTAVVFNTAKRQEQKKQDGDVRAHIHNRDRVTLSLKKLDGRQLSGYSESLGQVRIDRAAIESMDFYRSLFVHWKFDEGKGRAAYASTGSHRATIHGARWATGKVGGALSFDGKNDRVVCENPTSFETWNGTWELWFWAKSTTTTRALIGKDTYLYNDDGYVLFWGRKLKFAIDAASGRPIRDIVSDSAIKPRQWFHLAVTFGAGGMKMFINGVQQKDTDPYTGGIISPGTKLEIGDGGFTGNPFKGMIDEVAIYDRPLSPEEIQEHYQNGLKGK